MCSVPQKTLSAREQRQGRTTPIIASKDYKKRNKKEENSQTMSVVLIMCIKLISKPNYNYNLYNCYVVVVVVVVIITYT